MGGLRRIRAWSARSAVDSDPDGAPLAYPRRRATFQAVPREPTSHWLSGSHNASRSDRQHARDRAHASHSGWRAGAPVSSPGRSALHGFWSSADGGHGRRQSPRGRWRPVGARARAAQSRRGRRPCTRLQQHGRAAPGSVPGTACVCRGCVPRTTVTAYRAGGQLELLPSGVEPERAELLAGTMRREVSRLARLVDDLLSLAQLDAQGRRALRGERVDLGTIAQDVYQQARVLPAGRGRTLRLCATGAYIIDGDPGRLHQALLNLVVNALQHAAAGDGWVELALTTNADQILVSVRDNGPGIP